jgi:hypothetical protein
MRYSPNVVNFFNCLHNAPQQAQKFRDNRTRFLNVSYPPDTPGLEWPTLSDQDKQDIMNMSFEDVNRWNYTFNTKNAQLDGDVLTGNDVTALHGNGIPFMNQVDLKIYITDTEIHVDVNAFPPAGEAESKKALPPPATQTGVVHIVGVISTAEAVPLPDQDNLILIQPDSRVTFDTDDPHYKDRTHVKANGYIKPGTGSNDSVISLVFNENIDKPVHDPAAKQTRARDDE